MSLSRSFTGQKNAAALVPASAADGQAPPYRCQPPRLIVKLLGHAHALDALFSRASAANHAWRSWCISGQNGGCLDRPGKRCMDIVVGTVANHSAALRLPPYQPHLPPTTASTTPLSGTRVEHSQMCCFAPPQVHLGNERQRATEAISRHDFHSHACLISCAILCYRC